MNSGDFYFLAGRLLNLLTLVFTVVPLFYAPWYLALPIVIGVWFCSLIIRAILNGWWYRTTRRTARGIG
jgi:hypothetical protein